MAGSRKSPGRILVMQRVWRVGRPVTPNGPGGRQSRRGRATAVEPARLASQADKRKGFPKASDAAAHRGRAWRPASGTRIRFTHGVRFPPPPPAPRPAGEPARPERRRTRFPRPAAAVLRSSRAPRRAAGARTCRSGLRAVAAGVIWELHRPRLAEAPPLAIRANAATVVACTQAPSRQSRAIPSIGSLLPFLVHR